MRHLLSLSAVSTILAVTLGLSACGQPTETSNTTSSASNEDCRLIMGFESWEPYQYLDVGDTVRGLDVELAQAVTTEMGCSLDFQQGTWMDLLGWLENGDIHFIAGASFTEQREAFSYYSDPYRQEQFVLFIRTGENHRYEQETLADFVTADHKVGIVNEYFYGDRVRELFNDEEVGDNFVGAMIGELNLARLMDEDIDGFLEDRAVGLSMIRRKGLDEYIEASTIELDMDQVFMAFSRESVDEEQVEAFNQALTMVRDNGTYQAIMQRYMGM